MYVSPFLIASLMLVLMIYASGSTKYKNRAYLIGAFLIGALSSILATSILLTNTASPLGLLLAAGGCVGLMVGTLQAIKLHKQRTRLKASQINARLIPEYSDIKPHHERKEIPWQAWGLVYMGCSLGAAIGLHHSEIKPSIFVTPGFWVILLLLGAVEVARSYLHAMRADATQTKILLVAAKIPILLAGSLIPGVVFLINPFTEGIGERNPFSPRQKAKLLVIWSIWGIFCGVLAGLFWNQAAFFPLFGAMFLVPAMVGLARYQGVITS